MSERSAGRARLVVITVVSAVALATTSAHPAGAAGPSAPSPTTDPLLVAARAGHTGDPLSYLPASSRAIVSPVLDRATTTRAALATHSYLRAAQAVLAERGVGLPATPALPAPGAVELARSAGLPPSLRAPIAGLDAAVDAAAARLGAIPLAELQAELAAVDAANASYPSRVLHAPTTQGQALPTGQHVQVHAPVSQLAGLQLQPATAHAVAEDPSATLLIGAALDHYLPQIAAASGSAPNRAGIAISGCDLLDQSPLLCVGSNADNTYSGDEMLLMDLGGNNTYNGGAGSAPFLPAASPNPAATVPVSVNIDMGGGQDVYNAPVSSLATDQSGGEPGLVMGQAGAVFGGVAFSVNVSGNDTYVATALAPPTPTADTPAPFTLTVAQGSALTGYALLFDGGGNDTYTLTEPTLHDQDGRWEGLAQGAASGFVGAVGALIETGGGNDQYRVDAGGEITAGRHYAFSTVIAQGATEGWGTAALLADDGGTDSFDVDGSSTDAIPSWSGFDSMYYTTQAQGYASIGVAQLLEGSGSHNYHFSIDMNGGGDGLFGIAAQSAADQAGEALLQDLGGPNSFDLESVIHHTETRVVDDTCGCSSATARVDAGAGDDPAILDSNYLTVPEVVIGQGGSANGVAVLDNGGAATYTMVATASMDVTLQDKLSAPAAAANLDVQGFYAPFTWGQGAQNLGYPDETPTAGVLINRSGPAAYTFRTGDPVRAVATSLHGPTPVVHARTGFSWEVGAQGAGVWESNPPTATSVRCSTWADPVTSSSPPPTPAPAPPRTAAWPTPPGASGRHSTARATEA